MPWPVQSTIGSGADARAVSIGVIADMARAIIPSHAANVFQRTERIIPRGLYHRASGPASDRRCLTRSPLRRGARADRAYPKLIHYNQLDKGGHFFRSLLSFKAHTMDGALVVRVIRRLT